MLFFIQRTGKKNESDVDKELDLSAYQAVKLVEDIKSSKVVTGLVFDRVRLIGKKCSLAFWDFQESI